MKQIQVLVVDDSAFMRKVVTDILQADSDIKVIGTARNGADASVKNLTLKPDVITMDVEMPVLDGLGALKIIMKERPCPVVMVSSTTKAGGHTTMLAMENGAVDFVSKTSGPISLDLFTIAEQLREKVKLAVRATIVMPKVLPKAEPNIVAPQIAPTLRKLVAIGVSTGGPKALKDVLVHIPDTLPAPIVIVQHMPAGFTKSLADRLNSLCSIHVKEAEHGDLLRNGYAYIAPGGKHLMIIEKDGNWVCKLTDLAVVNGHRPSVDVLFHSVSQLNNAAVVAVVMTGMGADGAKGLKQLKENPSCWSLAQSEETSVVFGMPKMAIRTNSVDEIVHLHDLASRIVSSC
ncbi:protein-glutamate methylesterase/protein-glutamine glutaminase [Alkalicoccobacillus murimartini]|uniref:Protein-glutamate methylesterase/protein-glutamine glutaminase n=1 Tax=Alkalicoccobacillus murimartini TaxID=171685 RepID=A0ABT9YGZ9_9BACI|nr:chemotaxis response regulator protein-glutamate methylesterase [Alkalicoccobacillus murimartini]MDQ0206324.1 two-component system chemotaxis response regulator CheB [Alkalicoccobacillus murimartini]